VAASWVEELLAPGRALRPTGTVLSALAPTDPGTRYDRWPGVYDRLVGNGVYNARRDRNT